MKIGLSIISLIAGIIACQGATYYVAKDGDDARDGLNYWTNAVATISNGVAKANNDNDVVLVSNGNYRLTAHIIMVLPGIACDFILTETLFSVANASE